LSGFCPSSHFAAAFFRAGNVVTPCCFGAVQIASGVEGDAFPHGAVGRIRFVGRNEHRYFAVFETPDPDAPEPAPVNLFSRL
jgi:hypothetical protein